MPKPAIAKTFERADPPSLLNNFPRRPITQTPINNAAATLKALNQFWQLHLSSEELESIGTEIGADVPFFFN